MKIQISFREDGSLQTRSLKGDRALIALTAIRARRDRAAELIPTSLRAALHTLFDDSDGVHARLEEAYSPEPESTNPATPEPPADLVRIAPVEILTSVNGLNHLIDSYVGGVESILQGYARGIDPSKTQAAQTLLNAFFSDGRVFLSFDNQRQWLQVDQRFSSLSPEATQALDILGLRPSVHIITQLNDFFGTLLGVTQAPSDPNPQPSRTALRIQAQEDFDLWMRRLISLANLAFPSHSPEDQEARTFLLDPYLEPIFKASRTRRRKVAATRSEQSDTSDPSNVSSED